MAHFVYPVPANAQPGSAVQVTTASHSYAYSAASTPAVNTYTSAYNKPTTTESSISGDTTLRTTGAKTEEVKAAPEPAAAAKPAEPMQTSSDDLKDDEHLNILGEKDVAPVGYDAAVYSAASSSYQQQQAAKAIGTWAAKKPETQPFKAKPKGRPKTPQLHYCDVCKISCAGPQAHREHLEGQKHKKKEAAMKVAATPVVRGGHNRPRCELCDVTCTGADAYAAHIRGAKHQKVVKLHTKLGKPIPSTDPVLVTTTGNSIVSVPKATSSTISAVGAGNKTVAKSTTSSVNIVKNVVATPKITFVGDTTLRTTGAKTEEVKAAPEPAAAAKPAELMQTSSDDLKADEHLNILGEKDVAPVGHEYIEEVRNEQGKTVSFNCTLCECEFKDSNAKEMHLKGRRHRMQYKKKVDPNLQVEMKPSIRARKVQEDKLRLQAQKEEFWRRRQQENRLRVDMRKEEEMYWKQHRRYDMEHMHRGPMGMMGPRGPFGAGPGPMFFQDPPSPRQRNYLVCDLVCLLILTPVTLTYLCAEGAGRYARVTDGWQAQGLFVLTFFVIFIYVAWLLVAVHHHFTICKRWRTENQVVKITFISPIRSKRTLRSPSCKFDSPNSPLIATRGSLSIRRSITESGGRRHTSLVSRPFLRPILKYSSQLLARSWQSGLTECAVDLGCSPCDSGNDSS